jgi:uncharacterized protein YjbI with pentapeptide repeats
LTEEVAFIKIFSEQLQNKLINEKEDDENVWLKSMLFTLVKFSKHIIKCNNYTTLADYDFPASSNSITILNAAKENLSNLDLSEIKIPKANLQNSNLQFSNFSNADLTSVNLANSNISNSDFRNAKLTNSIFNIQPPLELHSDIVTSTKYS